MSESAITLFELEKKEIDNIIDWILEEVEKDQKIYNIVKKAKNKYNKDKGLFSMYMIGRLSRIVEDDGNTTKGSERERFPYTR